MTGVIGSRFGAQAGPDRPKHLLMRRTAPDRQLLRGARRVAGAGLGRRRSRRGGRRADDRLPRTGSARAADAQRIAPQRRRPLTVPPASVDLRQWAVTPGDQGAVSSCVTWAIDYAMLGWYSQLQRASAGQPFAPMYTYSQINGGVDGGSYPTAALDVAVTQGSDTRADYTQGDYDWRDQPTAAEQANAGALQDQGLRDAVRGFGPGRAARRCIKQALATKHPVAIEMAVRNGFDYLGANPAAVDDDITAPIRGYHEVLAVGYDAAGLIIENSWGTGWANGGFGRLSWRVVQNDVVGRRHDRRFRGAAAAHAARRDDARRSTVVTTAGSGARHEGLVQGHVEGHARNERRDHELRRVVLGRRARHRCR